MKNLWRKIIFPLSSHQKGWKRFSLGLGSLIVFIILVDGVVMPIWVRRGWDTTVPNFLNTDFQKASRLAKQSSLKIEVVGQKYDPNHPAGTVIFQTPEPESRVKKDRIIKVTVSQGGETVIVPSLAGQPLEQAEIALSDGGLRLGDIIYSTSDSVRANCVIASFPQAGSKVPVGMAINLVVNQGSLIDSTSVPDLIGRNLAEGKKMVEKSGLKLGEVRQKVDLALLPETILAQSLEPGQKVPTGTRIDLIVSSLEE